MSQGYGSAGTRFVGENVRSPAGRPGERHRGDTRGLARARPRPGLPLRGRRPRAAVLATCHRPRRRGRGRGVESDQVALERGRLDAVIAGLLFMAGMRRSEVSVLRWADVADATDGDGVLVTVRRSKTNQEGGETKDVRFVKDGVASAIRTLQAATRPEPGRSGRAAVAANGGVAVHGGGQGRRRRGAGDRPFGTGRAGVGADEPGRVDDRRDARRELEDEPDGSPTTAPGRPPTAELSHGTSEISGRATLTEAPLSDPRGGPQWEPPPRGGSPIRVAAPRQRSMSALARNSLAAPRCLSVPSSTHARRPT